MSGCLRPKPAAARPSCIRLGLLALAFTLVLLIVPLTAWAQPVRGEATLAVSGGYGRILLQFPHAVDVQVRTSGNILVIGFRQPVDVAIDRIVAGASEWVGAARRDPDGRALRIALARKLKVNKIDAGERIYIDLLPESWTGPPPSLPQDVVEELARRAREAERLAQDKARLARIAQAPPTRVRVVSQPAFTRYIFDLGQTTGVSSERGEDRLTLSIAGAVRLDLAEAKLASPPVVGRLESKTGVDATTVTFDFKGPVDLRTFREDASYMVDVMPLDPRLGQSDAKTPAPAIRLSGVEPPQTVPASPPSAPPAVRPVAPLAVAPAARAVTTMPGVGAPADDEPPAPGPVHSPPASAGAAQASAASAAAKPASETSFKAEAPVPPSLPADAAPAVALPAVAPLQPTKSVAGAPAAAGRSSAVVASLRPHGDAVQVVLPFRAPAASAVFMRANMLWMVFDSAAAIDVAALRNDPSGIIRDASATREGDAQVVRLKLDRPRIASVTPAEAAGWTVSISDNDLSSSEPLVVTRHPVASSRTGASIAFENPRRIHWLRDPDAGDTLMVVTGFAPARGFARGQAFIEFSALMSTHGIVIQRHADDLTAEIVGDKVQLGRPAGLTLSDFVQPGRRADGRAVAFDTRLWGYDRQANFGERQIQLTAAAAAAANDKRHPMRIDLARFYLSRDLFTEAKAVLDVAIADEKPTSENTTPLLLRSVANVMLGRTDLALKDLANPLIAAQDDAQLWRAVAYARQGNWADARAAFRKGEPAMQTLPVELQRLALRDNLRSAIESGDFATGSIKMAEFEAIGVPRELQPSIALLSGRLHEGLGRKQEALTAYKIASESWDGPSAAQGRLRELLLRYAMGEVQKPEVIGELESLTTTWRGDETEVEALQLLARLYTEEGRYRDAFYVMRTALTAHPNSDLTRRIQDGASVTFDSLFLSGKADALPAIDALSLFYDFRELMPIGRRGDEMIRRLADRLVSVDLLDQAAELLQHQVDHRLQGAARAQVASRLAAVYLMARKPHRAQAALRATSVANLSDAVRKQRILIEGRALSDIGRHDLALEAIEGLDGPDALRLRADIHWAAQRWREAAEQIEIRYGDRWREFEPLSDEERSDILRMAMGYALAGDTIGLSRLREKYEAKMKDSLDARRFEVATEGAGQDTEEFRELARSIARIDTLDAFLRNLRSGAADTNVVRMPASGPSRAGQVASADTTSSIPLPRPRRPQAAPRIQAQ